MVKMRTALAHLKTFLPNSMFKKMNLKAILLTALLICGSAFAADDWEGFTRAHQVYNEGTKLLQSGNRPEAIEKLEEAERMFSSLRGDGSTFRTQVDMWIKVMRLTLSPLYTASGQSGKGLPFLLGQYEEFRKSGGKPDFDTIELIKSIARNHFANADYEKSLEFADIGLKEADKASWKSQLVFTTKKTELVVLKAKSMLFLGQINEAVATFDEGMRVYESAFRSEPLFDDAGNHRAEFARACQQVGQFVRAEAIYGQALASLERLQREQMQAKKTNAANATKRNILTTRGNLAGMYIDAGQHPKGRELTLRVIADAEKEFGPNFQGYAVYLGHLVNADIALGMYGSALQNAQRALAISEKQSGPDSANTAASLRNLASLHLGFGDYKSAENMLQRVLKIRVRLGGEFNTEVAEACIFLSSLYVRTERHEEALEMARRALQITERNKSLKLHALALGQLASTEALAGQQQAALGHASEALSVVEKTQGTQSYPAALAQIRLADILVRAGKFSETAPLAAQALGSLEATGHANSDAMPIGLAFQALAANGQGQREVALQGIRKMLTRLGSQGADAGDKNEQNQALRRRLLFHGLRVLNDGGKSDRALADSFEAVQLARTSDAADAVAQMTTRFAAGDSEIAGLIRARQDQKGRYQSLAKNLSTRLGSTPPAAPAVLESLRAQVEDARRELAALDTQVAQRFPKYSQLIDGRAQSLAEVRAVLEPGEAMVSFLSGPDLRPGYELPASAAPMIQVYVWVIRRDGGTWLKLNVGQKELEKLVQEVRKSTDLSGPTVKPYATNAAHALYQKLFAPLKPQLAGIQRLVIVPDGPLTSLPFPALLTAPAAAPAQMAGYRKLPWLAASYGLNILPSEGSLVALRRNANTAQAQLAMAGFGDPLFQGTDGSKRGIKSPALYNGSVSERGAIASIDSVRKLARLPETADELRQVAKILGSGEQSLFLQQRASEEMVKRTDLTQYRVISFATHGLMAGEFSGLAEPGLALTPPAEADSGNEGFLSSSEAAQLKLNADWVVLSACNTASPDGKPGANGLSGLSSAFLYAGARSVLVSHWAVDSEATVALMGKLFANRAKGMSKAESHRKAMLALMSESKNPDYAHPAFWAPFIVIGEGK